MAEQNFTCLINCEADVSLSTIKIRQLCREIELDETFQSRLMIAASELGHNILKYAHHGKIQVAYHNDFFQPFIEIIAVDNGEGISDIDKCMQDSYSSSGTLGMGLPGVKRMMDEFDITSKLGEGTRVRVSRFL